MENIKEASNTSVTSQLISQLQPISDYWLSQDLTPQSDLMIFWDAYRLHRNLFVHTQLQFWQSNDSYNNELFAGCILLFNEMGDALDKIKAAILIYASVYASRNACFVYENRNAYLSKTALLTIVGIEGSQVINIGDTQNVSVSFNPTSIDATTGEATLGDLNAIAQSVVKKK